ncbi:unnamed protein product [Lampetra fluviatilis]
MRAECVSACFQFDGDVSCSLGSAHAQRKSSRQRRDKPEASSTRRVRFATTTARKALGLVRALPVASTLVVLNLSMQPSLAPLWISIVNRNTSRVNGDAALAPAVRRYGLPGQQQQQQEEEMFVSPAVCQRDGEGSPCQ